MSSKTQDVPPAVLVGTITKGAECLAGGGEMGALMRSIDWSQTGLGPVARWPKSLKTMVAVMLANRFPMLIWWGPELLQLYNDAYRPVLGVKHPASMGAPCAHVWPEIWNIIAPMIRSVMDGGPAQFHEHMQLFLNSRGVGEETFHTFACSPIPDDDGRIGGVLNTVQETTEKVQDDRQLRMLRDLAAHSADAKSAEEACRTAAGILALNDADLPFALFYLRRDDDSDEVELVSASGLDEYRGPAKPLRVSLSRDRDGWPFQEAERTGRAVIVDDLQARFGSLAPTAAPAAAAAAGRWGGPQRAVVLPLSRIGHPRPHGFFVAGVSRRRKLDERYLGLFQLTADQVMTAIANARSYEEARQKAEALAELNREKTTFFSNVSHEFRTPLTLILGSIEHALNTPSGALIGQDLRTVHRNAVRLLKLVDTLHRNATSSPSQHTGLGSGPYVNEALSRLPAPAAEPPSDTAASAQLELARVQRLVEERLARDRQRLHTFLMEAPAAIAIVRGPKHVFELANARYRQLVGGREILGKPGREVLPELIGLGVWAIFDRIYATGQPFVGEGFPARVSRSGSPEEERFFNWIAQATHDQDGNIDGIMQVVIEVTEQIRARHELERARLVEQELRRAAEAASRAKDEFLAMLGHELRNPLAPIATALHLMRLRGVTVVERERVVIERQVGHLTRLVDDLLDVSRITRGKVELQTRRIEIFEVVTKAIEMASPMLEQRQHHLSLSVAAQGLAVQGDLSRLAQVIANLLTNAAKYTEPAGHIAINARRDGNEIAIQVSDDGVGIAPELLPHIFELFMQERQALDRSSGGLGLGLAIVRSLVVMHGGSVEAQSEGKGRGSVFTIRLPAAVEQSEVGANSGTWAPIKPSGKSRSILVVDDNEDAAEVLASSLELLGHVTRVAHDGPAALRTLADFKPDVALLDIGLPVMDGYELARRLRQEPTLANIHLVAVTGYGQESDRQRSREAGFDAHLVKPIKLPDLEGLLKNLTESERSSAKRS